LSADDSTPPDSFVSAIDPAVSRLIFLMMLGLMAGGFVAFRLLSRPAPPAPPEVAGDPLLSQGRTIFLGRCATCHGNEGRGDGPIAGNLIGPPVGNLTDDQWKHGDRPDQVLAVISKGVPGSRMDAWSHVLDPPDLRAVAAYVYYLAKRPVPDGLRKPAS
jgi:cytochrome c oxidase cbb3-type subunit III